MKRRSGRTPKYPWREWFGTKGTKRTLVRGKQKDFTCEPYSFMIQARGAASRLRVSLRVSITRDRVTIFNAGRLR